MAQTGATPISLYYSATTTNVPTAGNLVAGELAINTNDGKLFYKDSSGVVQTLATKASASGSFTDVAYTGTLTGGTGVVNLGSGQFYKDASGNIGVGTSSPNVKLEVIGNIKQKYAAANSQGYSVSINATDDVILSNYYNAAMRFETNNTERMRIDSSGNLLVGTTTTSFSNTNATAISAAQGYILQNHINGTSSGTSYTFFAYNATQIGSISQAGTTGVLYSVTSDYRLKTVISPITNAGQRIDALQPIEYDWNTGGRAKGFLAHKFAEVYPNSVTGEKDAVDEEGKPVYQAMQSSSAEVMADLISEIQSLRKRIATLEAK